VKGKDNQSLILDTSVLIGGFDPNDIDVEQYITPQVRGELREKSILLTRVQTAVEAGRLKVEEAEPKFSEIVLKKASKIGDSLFLSQTDLALLALALQLKEKGKNPIILTEDYSMQNVASLLGIDFASISTFGIKYRYKWTLYCPACGKMYPPNKNFSVCMICGVKLKSKISEKERLR